MSSITNLSKLTNGKTHLITGENVYGQKGRGGMADLTATPQPEVERIGQQWYDRQQPGTPPYAARELGQKWKVRPCIYLPAQSLTTLMEVKGQGAITHIWITTEPKNYRDLILRMYWDGEEAPSVEVPLGDFFGCPFAGRLKLLSIPINVNPTGGMNCYLPMPFRRGARITIENRRLEPIPHFFYAISWEEHPVAEEEGYFHAQFRRSNPLSYGEDYVILDGVKGKGHYIGTLLGWQQNSQGWWGEGEVKMFLDGDKEFPTYVGTGTEDYFGGAWCFGENFSAPFLGYQDMMNLDGSHETNRVGNRHAMYRFHVMDPIRFETDLKVTIQAIGWRGEGRYLPLQDDICSVAMWYQTLPHAPFPTLGDRDALEVI